MLAISLPVVSGGVARYGGSERASSSSHSPTNRFCVNAQRLHLGCTHFASQPTAFTRMPAPTSRRSSAARTRHHLVTLSAHSSNPDSTNSNNTNSSEGSPTSKKGEPPLPLQAQQSLPAPASGGLVPVPILPGTSLSTSLLPLTPQSPRKEDDAQPGKLQKMSQDDAFGFVLSTVKEEKSKEDGFKGNRERLMNQVVRPPF